MPFQCSRTGAFKLKLSSTCIRGAYGNVQCASGAHVATHNVHHGRVWQRAMSIRDAHGDIQPAWQAQKAGCKVRSKLCHSVTSTFKLSWRRQGQAATSTDSAASSTPFAPTSSTFCSCMHSCACGAREQTTPRSCTCWPSSQSRRHIRSIKHGKSTAWAINASSTQVASSALVRSLSYQCRQHNRAPMVIHKQPNAGSTQEASSARAACRQSKVHAWGISSSCAQVAPNVCGLTRSCRLQVHELQGYMHSCMHSLQQLGSVYVCTHSYLHSHGLICTQARRHACNWSAGLWHSFCERQRHAGRSQTRIKHMLGQHL